MDNIFSAITPRRLKLFALLNISVQTISPVLLAFTPKMVAAEAESNLLGHAPAIQIQTKVYTLSNGETTHSVASYYNMTIDSLRSLNRSRMFSRGFEHLQEGDELDVPLFPLPEVTWDTGPEQTTETNQAQQDHANYAVKAGSFLASSGKDKAAVSMARGMATGAAESEIEQWLSQFGTARVKIDADEKFSLKNSQLDMLVPFYDRNTDMLYTQGSIHRTDDRTQANFGFGWRHFDVTHMFGGNVFYDRDLSRNHSRLGIGGEYWRDFIKLGANSYFRLSNWRNSPDVSNYEERPANGWDLRAQAWLPTFPQLGGNLTVEKYYGNEVALFGKDNRQSNPHAVAAGVNFTPVPLVTFSAEHRQGKQGADDTRLGIELNWQPGVPWQHQINPEAVGVMRSLEGSRYNLVERNNNIVLEYRKEEFLRLKTAALVTGYTGDEKSLGVSVNSKYGLARIDWDAGVFLAAGGSIVQNNGEWSVVLPAWQSTGENTYTIGGTAVDKRNNRSNKSITQVTVKAPIVSAIRSTFTPPQTTIPADGLTTQLLTLVVKDDLDKAIDLPLTSVSLGITGLKEAKVSELTKKNDGVYELVVTAGQQEEIITITPTVLGLAISPAVVNVKNVKPEGTRSAFSASPKQIAADGAAVSTLTFTARDAQGNPVTGLAGSLSFAATASDGSTPSAEELVISAAREEAEKGIYTAELKGTRADTFRIVPQHGGTAVGGLADSVELLAGLPEGTRSAFSATPKQIAADGAAVSTLTFTARDAQGNPVTGLAGGLSFAATASDGSTPAAEELVISAAREGEQGIYTAELKGTRADTFRIVPQHGGAAVGGLADSVELLAGLPEGTRSAFSASPKQIAADGAAVSTLTFTARDAQGNPVTGLAGGLSFAATASDGSTPSAEELVISAAREEVEKGIYTAELKGTRADTFRIVPQHGGTAVGGLADSVELLAGLPEGTRSAFSATPKQIAADGAAVSTLTFTARDAQGNPVTGLAGGLSFAATASDGSTPSAEELVISAAREGVQGIYTAELKGTRADTFRIVPQHGGTAVGGLADSVELLAGLPEGTRSAFSATPKQIAADGAAVSTLTFTARDAQGNPVTGLAGGLSFAATASDGSTPAAEELVISAAREEAEKGIYTAELKGTRADTFRIVPQHGGTAVGGLADSVELLAGLPEGTRSAFSATPKQIAADGAAVSTLTFTARDAQGNPVTGLAGGLSFAATASDGSTPAAEELVISAAREGEQGIYTAELKGTRADTFRIVPQHGGTAVGGLADSVELLAGLPEGTRSAFSATPKQIAADGAAVSTLTFTARDAQGNPVTGLAGGLSFVATASDGSTPSAEELVISAAREGEQGIYTAELKGTRADTFRIVPQHGGAAVGGLADSVELLAGLPEGTRSAFSATPKQIAADGAAVSTLTFTARDAQGNPVTGLAGGLSFAATASDGSTPSAEELVISAAREGEQGIYTAELKGTRADTFRIVPQHGGAAVGGLADSVELLAGLPEGTRSAFSATPKQIAADGAAVSTLTFTARDAQGNPVTGLAGGLSFAATASDGSTPAAEELVISAAREGEQGIYTAELKGTRADTFRIVPQHGGAAVGGLADSVELLSLDAATISIKKNKDKVKIGEEIILQIEVKDKMGNPLGNKPLNAVMTSTTNRQNESVTGAFPLRFDGKVQSSFMTDNQGMVTISVTDPYGKGYKHKIEFSADKIRTSSDVIFTVLTSPDTPAAKMWGHMADTLTTSTGVVLNRPMLLTEQASQESLLVAGERWVVAAYTESVSMCGSEEHVPERSDYISVKNDNIDINAKGWPTGKYYWTTKVYSNNQGGWIYSSNRWLEAQLNRTSLHFISCK